MNKGLKYIVFEDNNGLESVLMFSSILMHRDIARMIPWTVISAGFVDVDLYCYGRSESLRIGSRGQIDTDVIKREYSKF